MLKALQVLGALIVMWATVNWVWVMAQRLPVISALENPAPAQHVYLQLIHWVLVGGIGVALIAIAGAFIHAGSRD